MQHVNMMKGGARIVIDPFFEKNKKQNVYIHAAYETRETKNPLIRLGKDRHLTTWHLRVS